MEHSPPQSTPKRGRKACTQCRQQKVRCDVIPGSEEPCSRCRKMNLHCVISDPFKREHKRRRLSELERETTQLKQQLQAQSSADHSPASMLLAAAQLDAMSRPAPVPPPEIAQAPTPANSHSHRSALPSTALDATFDVELPKLGDPDEPTLPRRLENVELDPKSIDGIFELYYRRYYPWLPVMRSRGTPNFVYVHSPFLFWAIVSVAIRRYPADPNVIKSLTSSVVDLALMSLKQRDMRLSTIKGLLLLVAWPNPKGGLTSDVTFPLAGALPHVAMQCGLHVPVATQDFGRIKVQLTEPEIRWRAELWAQCVIVYQRLCSLMGQTPFILVDTAQDIEQRKYLLRSLSPSLQLQLNLQAITSRCCRALLGVGLQTMSMDQERALSILLDVFIQQIKDHEHEIVSSMDQLYVHGAYITVLMFHFYKSDLPSEVGPVTQLFLRAVHLLDHLDRMDQEMQALSYAPYQVIACAISGAVVLLRLLKSSATRFMDVERAQNSFFLSLDILKRESIEDDDLASRNVKLLTRLWQSDKAFKKADGTEHSALRIRSRLAMSPVFDALWWWRTEFGGQFGAYLAGDERNEASSETQSAALDTATSMAGVQALGIGQMPYNPGTNVNDQFLMSEMGWAFDDNFFLADMNMDSATAFDNFAMNAFSQPAG